MCLLFALCAMSSIAVFVTWTVIYRRHIIIPPKLTGIVCNKVLTSIFLIFFFLFSTDIPDWWSTRAITYASYFNQPLHAHDDRIVNSSKLDVKQIENEKIYPSKLGNFIYTPKIKNTPKIVCYYNSPIVNNDPFNLDPKQIDSDLCTHLNIGLADVQNNELYLDPKLIETLQQVNDLKKKNKNLKILLWVGGEYSPGFAKMVANHANRKMFIQSIKSMLELYRLDGIDLDWEFPSGFNRERQHFSQLLHEIRREYQREHRTYLLSVAVAAPENLVYFGYDIEEINQYADYVNIMTYDFHFYTKETPFTGKLENCPFFLIFL